MKCQILFPGKNKKNTSKCHLLKLYPEHKVLINLLISVDRLLQEGNGNKYKRYFDKFSVASHFCFFVIILFSKYYLYTVLKYPNIVSTCIIQMCAMKFWWMKNHKLIFFSLYPRHTKYVGVYSFRFSVRPFVRTYVRSFVRFSVTGSKFLR